MRIAAGIVIGRAADAAWTQDHRAIRQLEQVLLMAVPAQNHTSLNISQSLPDRGCMCSHKLAFRDILDKISLGRRAVAGENPMIRLGRNWQGRQPRSMALVQLGIGIPVRCTHPCRIVP